MKNIRIVQVVGAMLAVHGFVGVAMAVAPKAPPQPQQAATQAVAPPPDPNAIKMFDIVKVSHDVTGQSCVQTMKLSPVPVAAGVIGSVGYVDDPDQTVTVTTTAGQVVTVPSSAVQHTDEPGPQRGIRTYGACVTSGGGHF